MDGDVFSTPYPLSPRNHKDFSCCPACMYGIFERWHRNDANRSGSCWGTSWFIWFRALFWFCSIKCTADSLKVHRNALCLAYPAQLWAACSDKFSKMELILFKECGGIARLARHVLFMSVTVPQDLCSGITWKRKELMKSNVSSAPLLAPIELTRETFLGNW